MLPARLKAESKRALWAKATRVCQQCGKVITRADKPGLIYGAFMRLKFCSYPCSHVGVRQDHVAVFWSKVRKTAGCWLWTGGFNDKGYGVHHKDGKKIGAHRYSFELHQGPLGELHALHSCDNPACVNPDHLRAGTHQDNMGDAKARRRFNPRKGASGSTSKLTEEQARYILGSTEVGTHLAARFGVSKSTIYAIRNRQNWKDTL